MESIHNSISEFSNFKIDIGWHISECDSLISYTLKTILPLFTKSLSMFTFSAILKIYPRSHSNFFPSLNTYWGPLYAVQCSNLRHIHWCTLNHTKNTFNRLLHHLPIEMIWNYTAVYSWPLNPHSLNNTCFRTCTKDTHIITSIQ